MAHQGSDIDIHRSLQHIAGKKTSDPQPIVNESNMFLSGLGDSSRGCALGD